MNRQSMHVPMVISAFNFTVLFAAIAHCAGTIAVFDGERFPVYGTYHRLPPEEIARDLNAAGMTARLLSAEDMADPATFNAGEYAAYVHLYGNTFPLMAFANLRRFHAAGGSILSTGVPFCHPCVAGGFANWRWEPSEGSDENFSIVQEAACEGNQAARVHNPGNVDWTGITSDRLDAEPGEKLTVSGWVRSQDNSPDTDFLYVRLFDGGGGFIGQEGPAVPKAAAEWTHISKTVTVPEGAAKVDVSLQVWSGGATVEVDSIALVRAGSDANICPNPGFERPGGQWRDLGHDGTYFSHQQGLGTGDFLGPVDAECQYSIAQPNILQLEQRFADLAAGNCQWLDGASLPDEDEVVPIIRARAGDASGPPVAAIRHNCEQFGGAIDVWLGTQLFSEGDMIHRHVGMQIVKRAAAWVLREKEQISGEQFAEVIEGARREPWPEPPPTNVPIVHEPRPYETFFPKSGPLPEKLIVADVRAMIPEQRYLLTALQGLVNRGTPRLYLLFGGDDEFWLNQMLEKGYVQGTETVEDPLSLVGRFADVYDGAVIGDENLMVSNNITCMIAGTRNLLPASAELADELGLEVKEDLRGRFETNVEAYRWAFDEMLGELSHHFGICAHPTLAYNGSFDTIVQHKGICLWITGEKDGVLPGADSLAEKAFFADLFAKLPVNIPIRGFWWHGHGVGLGEGGGVNFAGKYGKITVVSDFIPNISVHSGVRIDSFEQKRAPQVQLDPTKAYCCFTMSDGDNLGTLYGYFRGYFNHDLHGAFPMGWGMGPAIIDLMPAIAEWYYDRQLLTDEFIADVSGIGYVFPQTYGERCADRQRVFDGFLEWTDEYMKRMDMHSVRPHGGDRDRMGRYALKLDDIHSIFADYAWRGLPYPELNYYANGTPVFHAATRWGDDDEWFCDQIRNATDRRPAFFNVFLHNWTFPMERIARIKKMLGDEYEFVTPAQLASLYRQAEER